MKKLNVKQMQDTKGGFIWFAFLIGFAIGYIVFGSMVTGDQLSGNGGIL